MSFSHVQLTEASDVGSGLYCPGAACSTTRSVTTNCRDCSGSLPCKVWETFIQCLFCGGTYRNAIPPPFLWRMGDVPQGLTPRRSLTLLQLTPASAPPPHFGRLRGRAAARSCCCLAASRGDWLRDTLCMCDMEQGPMAAQTHTARVTRAQFVSQPIISDGCETEQQPEAGGG